MAGWLKTGPGRWCTGRSSPATPSARPPSTGGCSTGRSQRARSCRSRRGSAAPSPVPAGTSAAVTIRPYSSTCRYATCARRWKRPGSSAAPCSPSPSTSPAALPSPRSPTPRVTRSGSSSSSQLIQRHVTLGADRGPVQQRHEPLGHRVALPPVVTGVGVGGGSPQVDDDPAAVEAAGRRPPEQAGLLVGEVLLHPAVGGQELRLVSAGRQAEPHDLDHS